MSLYVKLIVRFPNPIDPAVIPMLENALPPRKPVESFPKNIVLVSVGGVDTRSRGPTRDDAMEEPHASRASSAPQ